MRVDPHHPCDLCGRTSVFLVQRKYPAKNRPRIYVCGYHKRSYMTSEYSRIELRPKIVKPTFGYAPPELVTGYAPE